MGVVLELSGLALIVTGIAMWSVIVGVVAAGVVLLLIAWRLT